MINFTAPSQSLGQLDVLGAARLIAAASDIAVVVDRDGIIRDMACNNEELATDLVHGDWIGRPWLETVTADSRAKIQALLRDAASEGGGRSRQVNHPSGDEVDVPILYSAVRAGGEGGVVAFGRSLQQFSLLQRRLVEAQQSMERDYARLRHVETRYRLIFRVSSEPVLIVDVESHKVIEANPAASEMFGTSTADLLGKPLFEAFEPVADGPLRSLLSVVKTAGRADDVRARLRQGGEEMLVSAFIFRQENASLFLVRLSRMKSDSPVGVVPKMTWKLLKLVENAPDGFVVSDSEGRILSANASFLEMAQLASDQQALNHKLDRWLGRPGVDLDVLIANLRQRGAVRLFASTIQGELGSTVDVEISAASVMNSERPCFGFAIRNIGRRLKGEPRVGPPLPRSVAQLTELVGRVSLKDLVREATDVIEKLSIEAALQMTDDNRASAADLLGLSRQSLYVKLRRYGLTDPAADTSGDGN